MARGITTTNTTPTPITTETVVSETTNGGVIPGVTPNSKDSLITQTNTTPTLANNTVIPDLTTSVGNTGLTTTEDVTPITATTGKFARGLDKLKLKHPISKQPQKVLKDISVTIDTFNSIVAYVRDIADSAFFTDNYIKFLANKGVETQGTTSDSIITQIGYGRELASAINFADLGIQYNLSANYNDTTTLSEFIDIALKYIRDITGQDSANILDTEISISPNSFQTDTSAVTDVLANLFSAEIASPSLAHIVSDAEYTYSILKFLESYLLVATKTPITPYKLFDDQLLVQETNERVWNIFREFSDAVVSTDDYYGASNIDDDQYANFNKGIADSLALGDIVDVIPVFSLYIVLDDYYSSIDTPNILTNKLLDSSINSGTNELTEFTTIKGVIDSIRFNEIAQFNNTLIKYSPITIIEDFIVAHGRTLYSPTRPVDSPEFTAQNLVLDIVNSTDTLVPEMTFRRLLQSTGLLNDNERTLNVTKYAINPVVSRSETSILKGRFLDQETVSNLDYFDRQVDYKRTIIDLITTTDDYYGAANIDDDQYANFDKRASEELNLRERFAKYFTTIKADSFYSISTPKIELANYYYDLTRVSELESAQYFKVNRDNLTTTNPIVIDTTKPLETLLAVSDPYFSISEFKRSFNDQANAISSNSILVTIPKTDNVFQTATFNRLVNYVREIAENKVFSELVVNTAQLGKLETTTIRDDFERRFIRQTGDSQLSHSEVFRKVANYVRVIEDLINITDDYYGAANIDDDQVATVKKRLTDPVDINDLDLFILKNLYTIANSTTAILNPISLNSTKPLFDITQSSEFSYSNVFKVLTEPLSLSEIRYANVSNVLRSTLTATDPYFSISEFNRFYIDRINTTDYVESINTSIIKSDQVSIQDYYSRVANFYREVYETKTLSEQTKVYFLRQDVELLNTDDSKTARVKKYPDNDLVLQIDDFNTVVDFIRSFQDFVDVTDDYYAQSNIDDDQYADFIKTITDIVTIGEAVDVLPITFTLYTPQQESFTSSDESSLFVSKYPSTETVSNYKEFYLEFDKYTTDILYNYSLPKAFVSTVMNDSTITTSDDIAFSTVTYLDYLRELLSIDDEGVTLETRTVQADSISFSDVSSYIMVYRRALIEIMAFNSGIEKRYIQVNKDLDNTNNYVYLTNNDVRYSKPGKGVADQSFIFEDFVTSLTSSFGLYDTVRPTDDYYGASNIDDDQYATFNKTAADSFTKSERFIYSALLEKRETVNKAEEIKLNIGKNLLETLHFTETFTYDKYAVTLFSDQILKSDSGTINNQNYFASTYVEPGYAGTNRTIGS